MDRIYTRMEWKRLVPAAYLASLHNHVVSGPTVLQLEKISRSQRRLFSELWTTMPPDSLLAPNLNKARMAMTDFFLHMCHCAVLFFGRMATVSAQRNLWLTYHF